MTNEIKKYRLEHRYTQRALAEVVGWDQSRWANYEAGRRTPDVNDGRLIVQAFNHFGIEVTLDTLFPPASTAA